MRRFGLIPRRQISFLRRVSHRLKRFRGEEKLSTGFGLGPKDNNLKKTSTRYLYDESKTLCERYFTQINVLFAILIYRENVYSVSNRDEVITGVNITDKLAYPDPPCPRTTPPITHVWKTSTPCRV